MHVSGRVRSRPLPSPRAESRQPPSRPLVRSTSHDARPSGRDDRGPPAPRPLQHGQPAGQRARGDRVPRRVRERSRIRDGDAGHERRAPQPDRRSQRRGARPDAVLPRPRRHGARRSVGLATRPVVRRRRGRLSLGPRCPGHEVPGRGGGGGGRRAGARRMATRKGDSEARVRRRRGDGRRRRRPLADRAASGQGPLRHAAQRGRRRHVRARRPPPLRRVLRREGDLPLQADRPRQGRARVAPAEPARTRC